MEEKAKQELRFIQERRRKYTDHGYSMELEPIVEALSECERKLVELINKQ